MDDLVPGPGDLVLGLDVGGTSSRSVVVDAGGRVHGHGRAGGGNPVSREPALAMQQIGLAVAASLAGVDPDRVRLAVLGVAGFGNQPATMAALAAAVHGAGPSCPVAVVGDAEVAFAAGTPRRGGTVLIAGTGATACQVVDGSEGLTHDGWGWLLGDEGSGYWMGREAVRATLRDAERGRRSVLGTAVAGSLVGGWAPVTELVHAVHSRPPVAMAELAPLVLQAADTDPQARRIVDRAAELLVAAVGEVRGPDEAGPVVLAGGIASSAGVGGPLTARLAERWPGAPLRGVTSAEGGAAWLAARRCWPGLGEDVHARLCQPRVLDV